jgi:lipid-A-disaccharide synthase
LRTRAETVTTPLRVALAAGEASGDALGEGLIQALRSLEPNIEFFGVAGPRMVAAGCEPWFRAEELSVMGLAEVLKHLPRLLRLRRSLIERIRSSGADVFVGIDAPDFNLPAAAVLKAGGLPTVQYVSPQVWAWRQSRVRSIRRSVDLVLCLLPFETQFYTAHGVKARFIGHPLADAIPLEVSAPEARERLGLPTDKPIVAVLPGSRRNEVTTLARPFMETVGWLKARRPALEAAVGLVSESIGEVFRATVADVEAAHTAHLFTGRTREVMAAADVVLTASGTASLETLLVRRPMVVAYRIVPVTYWLYRRLGVAKLPNFSLPNLLAGRTLVPEFVQAQVRAEVLGPAVERFLDGDPLDPDWYDAFGRIHEQLRRGGSGAAAREVLELVRGTG